jgi:DNA-binding IclR family transcriptional regulator
MRSNDSKQVKSILKVAAIIDLLTGSEEPLSLGTIAKELGIAKSTLHGLISTLVDVGYVAQDGETGRYLLGFRLFEIGSSVSRKWNERKIAYPYMQLLAEQTGETVHLAALDDGEVLYINKQESSNSIRIVTDTGVKLPAYCTGVGKVLLAGLNPVAFKKYAKGRDFVQYTANTITELDVLKAELNNIRSQGYAIDEQEYLEGLRCIAAPIFNHKGEVTSALSVAGPLLRMKGETFEEKKRHILDAARNVSKQMGYQGGGE